MIGKTALVTGGGRGIGRGITEALAEKGWTVAVNYRSNREAAEKTVEAVNRLEGRAFAVQGDVQNLNSHETMVQKVIDETGRIDLLVNNAGIAAPKRADLLDMLPENYDIVMATNLRGPFFLTQITARRMIDLLQKQTIDTASIINISSISAVTASISRGEYCISKAGLSMMSALYAARLGEYGINVYEIRPGIVETEMTAAVREKYNNLIAEGLTIIPRWGKPSDIGKAAAVLAEGEFPYSTGGVFNVDGGFHVSRL